MNRIDRLTAILIQLQTKRVVKAEEISDRFEISLRTVYRDVKALMEAGVPIGSEAGKGYFIVDGYHLPPVMFTEDEASSMLVAGKLVEKMADKSVRNAFESAMYKVKAVLNESGKDHLQNLESHIEIFPRSKYEGRETKEFPNHFMTEIQRAVAKREVLTIDYSNNEEEHSQRSVEPIGIFYYSMAWHLIAWCRLRNGYRDFRADRIKNLVSTGEHYDARSQLTLKEYYESMFQSNAGLIRCIVTFDKSALRGRPIYGCIATSDLGARVRAEFLMDSLTPMARWLIMYGSSIEVEEPDELKSVMAEYAEDLFLHFSKTAAVARS